MSWCDAVKANMTLFGDPVTRRPTPEKTPDLLVVAGRSMAARLRRFHPDFFDGIPSIEERFVKSMARIGLNFSDTQGIVQKLKRDGWDDYAGVSTVLDDLDYWEFDILAAQEAFETQWVRENGLDLTFSGTLRAMRVSDGVTGWATASERYSARAAVLFVTDELVPKHLFDGELRGGMLLGAELVLVDLERSFRAETGL